MGLILVVEENPNLALGVRRLLELEGHQVAEARDAATALERARALGPELVVVDLALPRDGAERLLHGLRAAALPARVLLLTSLGLAADRARARRLGADALLAKPFGREELARRVDALLRPPRRPRRGRARP